MTYKTKSNKKSKYKGAVGTSEHYFATKKEPKKDRTPSFIEGVEDLFGIKSFKGSSTPYVEVSYDNTEFLGLKGHEGKKVFKKEDTKKISNFIKSLRKKHYDINVNNITAHQKYITEIPND